MSKKNDQATLAGGCFWCTEAIFKRLKGVISVQPGYTGGITENPTYEQICLGQTGHAEAIQINFNPNIISFTKLLNIFWNIHNPTTLNQQENDVGTQYRSAIFYHDKRQKEIAEKSKDEFEKEGFYKDPVVTQIIPFTSFYLAEDYHINYFEKNKNAPYCATVINPKIQKLFEKYEKQIQEKYKSKL